MGSFDRHIYEAQGVAEDAGPDDDLAVRKAAIEAEALRQALDTGAVVAALVAFVAVLTIIAPRAVLAVALASACIAFAGARLTQFRRARQWW